MFPINFILNKCQLVDCYEIHPYIKQFSNNIQGIQHRFPVLELNALSDFAPICFQGMYRRR